MDAKRRRSGGGAAENPSKRARAGAAAAGPSSGQTGRVASFQQKAIAKRLKEKNRELAELNRRLKRMQDEAERRQDAVAAVLARWNGLDRDLALLLGGGQGAARLSELAEQEKKDSGDAGARQPTLFDLLGIDAPAPAPAPADDDMDVDEGDAGAEHEAAAKAAVSAGLGARCKATEGLLRELLKRLSAGAAPDREALALQERFREMAARLAWRQAEAARLGEALAKAEERAADAEMQHKMAARRCDRLGAELEEARDGLKSAVADAEEAQAKAAQAGASSAGGAGAAEAPEEVRRRLAALEEDLEEARGLAEQRLQTEDRLREEREQARADLERLMHAPPPAEAVRLSPLYAEQLAKMRSLMASATALRGEAARLQSALTDSEAERQRLVEDVARAQRDAQEQVRREAARLSATAEQWARKHDEVSTRLERALRAASATQRDDASSLLAEVRKASQRQEKELSRAREAVRAMEREGGAPEAVVRLQAVVRQYREKEAKWAGREKLLAAELRGYKDRPTTDRERAALRQEVNQLREQAAAQKARLERLDPDGAGDAAGAQAARVKELQRESEEARDEAATQRETAEAMMGELDEMAKALEEVEEQNGRLQRLAADAEEATHRLEAEAMRARQQCAHQRTRAEKMASRAEASEEVVQQQLAAMGRLQELVAGREAERDSEGRRAAEADKQALRYNAQLQEREQQLTAAQEQCRDLERRVEDASRRVADVAREKGQLLRRVARAEESTEQMRRRLAKASAAGGQGAGAGEGSEGMAAELKVLKAMVTCKVCNDRRKNAVIQKCGHIFCKDCIDENLRTRHRKCPGCGLAFGADDVRSVFLA